MGLRAGIRDKILAIVTPYVGLDLRVEQHVSEILRNDPRQADSRSLNHFEYKCFSQSGEDGILHEIFRRLKVREPGTFVEIGVGDGLENNTLHLLQSGWRGLWLEADPGRVASIRDTHGHWISSGQLSLVQSMVAPDNALSLVTEGAGADSEPDLLSIDIDGNDYWVWSSLMSLRPKVVVIEYNAQHGPHSEWVMAYRDGWSSFNTTYHGASLTALNTLAKCHGYTLVGCSLSGANAFFVRRDLVNEEFQRVSPADVWQPLRLSFTLPRGHKPAVGLCLNGASPSAEVRMDCNSEDQRDGERV